jgi:hypothetical protein
LQQRIGAYPYSIDASFTPELFVCAAKVEKNVLLSCIICYKPYFLGKYYLPIDYSVYYKLF